MTTPAPKSPDRKTVRRAALALAQDILISLSKDLADVMRAFHRWHLLLSLFVASARLDFRRPRLSRPTVKVTSMSLRGDLIGCAPAPSRRDLLR